MSLHELGAEILGAREVVDVDFEKMLEWLIRKNVRMSLFVVVSRRPVVTGGARYIAPVVANVRKIT